MLGVANAEPVSEQVVASQAQSNRAAQLQVQRSVKANMPPNAEKVEVCVSVAYMPRCQSTTG